MPKRKQRAARIASVALLSSTVFANPPPAAPKKPADVIVNRPNLPEPAKAVDAGMEPVLDAAPQPVIINQVAPRPPPTVNRMPTPRPETAPDAGVRLKK